jgi:putative membrane protein
VHLIFATTSAVLWTVVTIRAWRNFEKPARPGKHSHSHRRWGWIAALDMVATSVTGWIFYWLAFVAT